MLIFAGNRKQVWVPEEDLKSVIVPVKVICCHRDVFQFVQTNINNSAGAIDQYAIQYPGSANLNSNLLSIFDAHLVLQTAIFSYVGLCLSEVSASRCVSKEWLKMINRLPLVFTLKKLPSAEFITVRFKL